MMKPMEQEQEQEREFGFGELFFSRTDGKGIIQAGNEVFARVSGFTWDELVKRPHNVIRHPDMPKAVFYVLWDRLKKGQPVGAYVKNRAKDGVPYWVFALAMPVPGGYLSVRVKPGSGLLALVKEEYRKLRAAELSDGVSAEASATRLLARLAELGFPDYEAFARHAIGEELLCRQGHLGAVPPTFLADAKTIETQLAGIAQEMEAVQAAYKLSAYAPLNLDVQASRLPGSTGAGMTVVSAHFQQMVKEIREEIGKFRDAAAQVSRTTAASRFLLCANFLLEDVHRFYVKETAEGKGDGSELAGLETLMRDQAAAAGSGLAAARASLGGLKSRCEEMGTAAAGLELVRLTGKIEVASVSNGADDLRNMLDQLGKFREVLYKAITAIGERTDRLVTTLKTFG